MFRILLSCDNTHSFNFFVLYFLSFRKSSSRWCCCTFVQCAKIWANPSRIIAAIHLIELGYPGYVNK